SFYSWSKTILVNECKALLQKRNKTVQLGDSEAPLRAVEWITEPHKESERQLDIEDYLQQLNAPQKEAIQLRYFHDLDYQTIANIVDAPLGTVKSRIHQGLKKLKDLFGRENDE